MRLLYKQLSKQLGRNKIFISLLFILTCLTSLSFFFVEFSVDGNMAMLNTYFCLTDNQQKYQEALLSNTRLAYIFLFSMSILTSFVFVMFFYRFFLSAQKQIGCLKSLGFTDSSLRTFFILFTVCISISGASIGMLFGYFLSDILIKANEESCSVTGLIRAVNPTSIAFGLLSETILFCLTTFLSYFFIRGKEPGLMINGKTAKTSVSGGLSAAERFVEVIPVRDKFPLRIALRKPLAVFLIIIAVMGFNVCFILGRSLNISSQKIMDSQTTGHYYEYNTVYTEFKSDMLPDDALPYLYIDSAIELTSHDLNQTILGLYSLGDIFQLLDEKDDTLPVPSPGQVYINPELAEIYHFRIGDTLMVRIKGQNIKYTVSGIASNAQLKTIYVNASGLANDISAPTDSYNGAWSMHPLPGEGTAISRSQRNQILKNDAVSNKTSAVINQVIGAVIGCILLFLALYLNFQDNQRDISILNLLGYSRQEIRKMLVYIYRPIVWAAFTLTIIPSILAAEAIQNLLSFSINDYMPFGTNLTVLVLLFLFQNVIYQLVEWAFSLGISRVCKKANLSEISAL